MNEVLLADILETEEDGRWPCFQSMLRDSPRILDCCCGYKATLPSELNDLMDSKHSVYGIDIALLEPKEHLLRGKANQAIRGKFQCFLKSPHTHLNDKNTHRQKFLNDHFGGCERCVCGGCER